MKARSTSFIFASMIILAMVTGVLWAMSNPIAIATATGSLVLAGVVTIKEDKGGIRNEDSRI